MNKFLFKIKGKIQVVCSARYMNSDFNENYDSNRNEKM